MPTSVVNILKTNDFDVYIGRAGFGLDGTFGNPYRLNKDGDREACIQKFRTYFYRRLARDTAFYEKVIALRNKRLGCFCSPSPCHGDVIAAFLNNTEKKCE